MYTNYMAKGRKVGFGESGAGIHPGKGGTTGDFDPKKYLLLGNSGLQGGIIFSSQEDYDRFEAYLYLLNAIEGPRASNFFLDGRDRDIFTAARGDLLVAIGAYSFTPKRFYILATPLAPNGIAKFMQKLQTAYTMYFNLKYQRDGRIFHGPYVSEAAHSERELKYFFARTQLHPAILFDAEWESAGDPERRALAFKASQYRYSSVGEYARKKFSILTPAHFPKFVYAAKDPDALLTMWKGGKKSLGT
jgi:hypothetical protein